jgi:hypothetical protein
LNFESIQITSQDGLSDLISVFYVQTSQYPQCTAKSDTLSPALAIKLTRGKSTYTKVIGLLGLLDEQLGNDLE